MVDGADAVAARARELGATCTRRRSTCCSVGRMAVIQDPQGAFFVPWEPRDHVGASLVNQAGALVWNELQSPDLGLLRRLLRRAVRLARGGVHGQAAGELSDDQERRAYNGGIRELTPPAPPNWLVYFGIEDLERR